MTVNPNNDYKPLSELLKVGARVVWAHVGWDNTGEQTVELFDALLTKYGNLYLQLRPYPFTFHKESHPLMMDGPGSAEQERRANRRAGVMNGTARYPRVSWLIFRSFQPAG